MFWGLITEPGKRNVYEAEETIHVSMATLQTQEPPGTMEKVDVYAEVKGTDYLLCTLLPRNAIYQVPLDLNFSPGSKPTFHVESRQNSTKNFKVHLTGYLPSGINQSQTTLPISTSTPNPKMTTSPTGKLPHQSILVSSDSKNKGKSDSAKKHVSIKDTVETATYEKDSDENEMSDEEENFMNGFKTAGFSRGEEDEDDDDDDLEEEEELDEDDMDLGDLSSDDDDDSENDNELDEAALRKKILKIKTQRRIAGLENDDDDEDDSLSDEEIEEVDLLSEDDDEDAEEEKVVSPAGTPKNIKVEAESQLEQESPKKKKKQKKNKNKNKESGEKKQPDVVSTPTSKNNRKSGESFSTPDNWHTPNPGTPSSVGHTPFKTTPKNEASAPSSVGHTPFAVNKKFVTKGGVMVQDIKVGTGANAKSGKMVTVKYVGRLKTNNRQFDAADEFKFRLGKGEVIKGWDAGIEGMKEGGKRKLTVPANMAYGKKGAPPEIPPNSPLTFDVELKKIHK